MKIDIFKQGNYDIFNIDELIDMRKNVQSDKNWEHADDIRKYLSLNGVVLIDDRNVTYWKRASHFNNVGIKYNV